MKIVYEDVIPKDVELFEIIEKELLKNNCWIFISTSIVNQLKTECIYDFIYPCGLMYIFFKNDMCLEVYSDPSLEWFKIGKLHYYSEGENKIREISKNPKIIIFMRESNR